MDLCFRGLTSWTYQHSASIKSARLCVDDTMIIDYAVALSHGDSSMILVMTLTDGHHIEIYSDEALNKDPLFRFFLGCSAKIHAKVDGSFLLLTSRGVIHTITQKPTHGGSIEFCQKLHTQLKIKCSMMFSSIVTLNSMEYLAIVSDNGQSLAIWSSEQLRYVDINSPPSALQALHGHSTQGSLLFYLHDASLIACQLQLKKTDNSICVQTKPCGRADLFCFKNQCLATVSNEKNQLYIQDVHSSSSRTHIDLEGQCEHMCLNDSGTYAFVVVKPRMLCMYRTIDGRQLAKLSLFNLVSCITADNDFVVLAMADRRLLTLMIADPQDPDVATKIQALPSR